MSNLSKSLSNNKNNKQSKTNLQALLSELTTQMIRKAKKVGKNALLGV
jgi:hypothetical protein